MQEWYSVRAVRLFWAIRPKSLRDLYLINMISELPSAGYCSYLQLYLELLLRLAGPAFVHFASSQSFTSCYHFDV